MTVKEFIHWNEQVQALERQLEIERKSPDRRAGIRCPERAPMSKPLHQHRLASNAQVEALVRQLEIERRRTDACLAEQDRLNLKVKELEREGDLLRLSIKDLERDIEALEENL